MRSSWHSPTLRSRAASPPNSIHETDVAHDPYTEAENVEPLNAGVVDTIAGKRKAESAEEGPPGKRRVPMHDAPVASAAMAAVARQMCDNPERQSMSDRVLEQLASNLAAGVQTQLEEKLRMANAQLLDLKEQLQVERQRSADMEKSFAEKDRTESAELAKLRDELSAHRTSLEAETAALRARNLELADALTESCDKERSLEEHNAAMQAALEQREADLARLVERGCAGEELRRSMHETISELKGNIRVFCRVRPPAATTSLGGDTEGAMLVHLPAGQLESTQLELRTPHEAADAADAVRSGRRPLPSSAKFQFDHVFGGAASQDDIFREVSQLTQSAIDGYKVCIFAYGQTGSGKTFTMQGARHDHGARGVVPRAAEQVFSAAAQLRELGWAYEFRASFLEIYNDELRDLLPPVVESDTSHSAARSAGAPASATANKLKLVDVRGAVTVPGLQSVLVSDAAQLAKLMDAVSGVRATGSTKLNEHSSRSHLLFRMHLVGSNAQTGATSAGELNLIDLAGSERTKESGVTGDAMREAAAINKSLASLGDVIAAMAAKAAHVPFRNSKLTHVLQSALSGSAKTLMFVNINPTAQHHHETLSSLRFAAKVNHTENGRPQKRAKGLP